MNFLLLSRFATELLGPKGTEYKKPLKDLLVIHSAQHLNEVAFNCLVGYII